MKFRVFLVLAAMLIVGPAFAQKIYIDYDTEYDGSKIKTFAWAESSKTTVEDADPMLHKRIVDTIEQYITEGGVQKVDNDPDVHVTYHGSSEKEISVDTAHSGYAYPSAWGYGRYGGYGGYRSRYYGGAYGGSGSATTTVSSYQVGTLIVDIWDAKTDELIWRGIAAEIVITQNPDKMERKLDKALKKMVKKWRKMKDK